MNQESAPISEPSNSEEPSYTWQDQLPVSENPVVRAAAIGILTSGPSGGYGEATFQPVTLHANGSWSPAGTEETVIIPLLK